MTRRLLSTAAILALVISLGSTALADETTRWINVHVTEPGTEINVEVRLPLSLVISVIDGINVESFHGGMVDLELDDAEIDWPAIIKAVAEAPDGEFVRAKTEDADVMVVKRDGMMTVDVNEHGGDNTVVKVSLPVSLLSALNIDSENRVDVKALLAGFDRLPDGELVRVTSNEANVRIWIE